MQQSAVPTLSLAAIVLILCTALLPLLVCGFAFRPSLHMDTQQNSVGIGTTSTSTKDSSRDTRQSPTHRLRLDVSPLIGGPSWLPIHVKVTLLEGTDGNHRRHSWDFLPNNATDPATIERLLRLEPVQGEIRYSYKENGQENRVVLLEDSITWLRRSTGCSLAVDRALRFSADYPSKDLHLLTNNCWTFAIRLWFVLINSGEIEK